MKTNGFAHAYVQFYCQWEKEILGRINSLPKLSPVGEPLLASEGGAAGVSLQGTFDLLRAAEELLKVQQRLRWAVQEIDPPYASETPEWSMLAYLDRNQEKLLFLERVDPGDSEITACEVVLWDGSSK